ncbi:MAG: ABC transporter ATP-binding protein/permease [Gemmataceae bacterium]|nr:ABC transporter ATP-binding protein/permease [Gemmataceae bacterium]
MESAKTSAAPLIVPPHHTSNHGHAHHHSHVSPLRRLFQVLRPETWDLMAVTVFALGVAVLSLVTPIAVEEMVNTIARGTILQPLVFMTLIMFGCLGLAAAFRAVQQVIVEYLQQRLFVRVVADLAYRLPRVPQATFDAQGGPELVNRFFDVLTLQKCVASLLLDGLSVVLSTLIGLTVLAFYHPFLLLFDLGLVFAMTAVLFLLGWNGVKTSITESIHKYRTAFWLQELVLHPRAFKSAGGANLAMRNADALAREYVLARRAHFRIFFRQILFMLFVQVAGSVILLGLGGWLVINRQLTLGQLVAAELIVTMVVSSFVKLSKSLETYYDLMAAVDKLGLLMDLPLERTGGEQAVTRREGLLPGGAAVRWRDVSFSHPDGKRVFDNVSLTLQPGERVALIGGTATGKSTLLELLDFLVQPTSGSITIDGADIRQLSLEEVHETAVLVQGIEIFDGTVIENVLLGREHLTAADARRALDQVGLLEEVLSWPDGLDSFLMDGGRSLSVGHSQLLMLARAIAGSPRLLLLDETLDTIDTNVRWRLLPMLTDPARPWTLVVATSRSEVIDLCDRVLELRRTAPGQPAEIVERPAKKPQQAPNTPEARP